MLFSLIVFYISITVFHNNWLDFLLQDINIKFFLFDWLLIFKHIEFLFCVRILIVWELSPNINNSSIGNRFFPCLSTWFSPQKSQLKCFYFLKNFGWENYQSRSCISIVQIQKCQKYFPNGLISIFKLVFLQNNWLTFFVLDLNLNLVIRVGSLHLRELIFFLVVDFWWNRKTSKSYWSWHASAFKKSYCFSSNCFIFHHGFIRLLFTWHRSILSKNHSMCPKHWLRVLKDEKR